MLGYLPLLRVLNPHSLIAHFPAGRLEVAEPSFTQDSWERRETVAGTAPPLTYLSDTTQGEGIRHTLHRVFGDERCVIGVGQEIGDTAGELWALATGIGFTTLGVLWRFQSSLLEAAGLIQEATQKSIFRLEMELAEWLLVHSGQYPYPELPHRQLQSVQHQFTAAEGPFAGTWWHSIYRARQQPMGISRAEIGTLRQIPEVASAPEQEMELGSVEIFLRKTASIMRQVDQVALWIGHPLAAAGLDMPLTTGAQGTLRLYEIIADQLGDGNKP